MSDVTRTDSAVRFLFSAAAVRGVWVHLDASCRNMFARKSYSAAERILLGESVAAAVLLSRTIKLQGRLALQARGQGLLRLLVAESTQDAGVRGVIELADSIALDSIPPLQQLVGDGYLAVTLLPDAGDSYQGIVPLAGGRLQDCLADYFALSEQLPTALWLAADGERAAGLMLQALPGDAHDAEAWQHLHTLAATLTQAELLGLSCEALLHRLFHQEGVQLFPAEAVQFQCTCSVERSRNALAILGRDELQKLFAEQPEVTMDCHFCGANYRYTADDLGEILGEPPALLH